MMMNNFQAIQQIVMSCSVDSMADYIMDCEYQCAYCIYNSLVDGCSENGCKDGIKEFLQKEV